MSHQHLHVIDSTSSALSLAQRLRGALSTDNVVASGAEAGDREALAAPCGATVFFAGEATHPAVNPCLQARLAAAHDRNVVHAACLHTN